MISRIFKIIGVIVGGLMGLLAIAAIAIYVISEAKVNQTYPRPAVSLTIPTDAASIERGRHLATAVSVCVDCHGPSLAGGVVVDDPAIGRIAGPNLTRGKNGLGNVLTDEDMARVIRFGILPDGKSVRVMPADDYIGLSDDDLAAIIAYVRSLPPVDTEPNQSYFGPVGRVLFALGQLPIMVAERITPNDHPAQFPQPGVNAEYGRYLAQVSGCMGCHNPALSGGKINGAPPDWPEAANLTPAGELATFDQAGFMTTMRTCVNPFQRSLSKEMPCRSYKNMTDDELKALWAYISKLPPTPYGQRIR